jgi:hypothetical protein
MASISLTPTRQAQLATICAIGRDGPLKLADRLDELGVVVDPAKLRESMASQLGDDSAEALQYFLLGLAISIRRGVTTAQDALDAIGRSIVSQSPDAPSRFSWDDCRPAIERLMASKSVVLAAKAEDLSSDFAQFCVDSRLLTDIRPVFNDARDGIVGVTIIQTLRIDYITFERRHGSHSIAHATRQSRKHPSPRA